ncbi:MAG: glucose-1-phosphate adenylyltransferase [Clostridia bacterium]|nr:glucose-1-phosphate adenylyltransferase [Clostridia bacterium]
MHDKKCLAMILAGGQGSRLGVLTKHIAKPALPYGGKYRIIDFVLSNCVHSGIDTVGVLTQYQPLDLNTYIGSGQPWDLNRNHGGVFILPPYLKTGAGEWYKGTANAIYQNMGFIERFNPHHVLILSGDHIYKMHYGKMLDMHIARGAAATIAVFRVPINEASRFGIMNTNADGWICEFEEKPQRPKNDLASMGIYLFNKDILKKYLTLDEQNSSSQNDFGKNVIPRMLEAGEKLYAYNFDGYWKDVGTTKSLWEANMDLIRTPPRFDLYDPDWTIFSRSTALPPHFVAESALLSNSIVTEGCEIFGRIHNSILFAGTKVGRGARVCNSIIFPGAKIEENAVVEKAIVGSGTTIKRDAYIGQKDGSRQWINTICEDDISIIGDGLIIDRGTRLCKGSMVEKSILTGREVSGAAYA